MSLRSPFYKLSVLGLAMAALIFNTGSTAFAHVTVSPSEVVSASYQTFTINVPNEKDIPTTGIRIVIPKEVTNATPTQKAGWRIAIEEGEGDDAENVKSIVWSNGTIENGLRDEFTFSAKVPEKVGEIQWKAYQTYSDGTVVSWDQKEQEGGHDEDDKNTGPFSITKVVAGDDEMATAQKDSRAIQNAQVTADRALYIAIAGVIVGLGTVFYATRKK